MKRRDFLQRATAGLIAFFAGIFGIKVQAGSKLTNRDIVLGCNDIVTSGGGSSAWFHVHIKGGIVQGVKCYIDGQEINPDANGVYHVKCMRIKPGSSIEETMQENSSIKNPSTT